MRQIDISQEREQVFKKITDLMDAPELSLDYDSVHNFLQSLLETEYTVESSYDIINYQKLIYILNNIQSVCPDEQDQIYKTLHEVLNNISKGFILKEKLKWRCFAEPICIWEDEQSD